MTYSATMSVIYFETYLKPVILAAGLSTRTRPLTFTRPKGLLPFFESTILENTLDALVDIFPEVVIVVGFLHEMIEAKVGTSYKGMKVTYLYIPEVLGTGGVLSKVRESIEPPFLVLNSDDVYSVSDIQELAKHERAALLSKTVVQSRTLDGWRVENGKIISLGSPDERYDFGVATGAYVISDDYFSLPPVKLEGKEEVGLPQTLAQGVLRNDYDAVFTKGIWFPVGYPWDLLKAHDVFWATGKPRKILGKNVQVDPGADLGDCVVIGDNVVIKSGAKISHAIIFNDTIVGKNSIIEDSIIGANVVIGDDVTIQKEHSLGQTWKVKIKDRDVDTEETKLGIFTGDHVSIPSKSVLEGAALIDPPKETMPQ